MDVDGQGLHPITVGNVPEPFAAGMRTQFSIIELITESYRSRSRKALLQALVLDPVVNSINEAEKMMDVMIELQQDFLPELK